MNAEPPERVRLGKLGELGLIRRIRSVPARPTPRPAWRSASATTPPCSRCRPVAALLATTDLLVEDVHFRRASATPADIGWKALAVNLSDIAAMGGIPRWALVALAVPADTAGRRGGRLLRGHARRPAAPHGVTIVGGDTSASPGGWIVERHAPRRAIRARRGSARTPAPATPSR